MGLKHWLQAQEAQWARLESLLERARYAPGSLNQGDLRALGRLYRAAAADLSRVQSTPEFGHLEPYLANLVQRAHGVIYERPPMSLQDVLRFFTVEFPVCFRRNAGFVLLAAALFALGTGLAMLTVAVDPSTQYFFLPPNVIEDLKNGVLWTDRSAAHPAESSFLMTNNIRVAINAYAFGMLFGVGTLLILFHNGLFAFGGPLQVCFMYGMGHRLLNFILPHGVIELTTVFIAGGAGMMVGFALLFPGDYPRWTAVRRKARESLVLIMGCVPLLVLAGLIEGLISLNLRVGTPVRLAVALLSAVGLFLYLTQAGRERKITPG